MKIIFVWKPTWCQHYYVIRIRKWDLSSAGKFVKEFINNQQVVADSAAFRISQLFCIVFSLLWPITRRHTPALPGSAGATGGKGGRALPNDFLCPPFRFTRNTFFEHYVTTRQQAITEKGIITCSKIILVRNCLDSLQNFLQPASTVHEWDVIISLINTPLWMCRGIGMQAYRIVTGASLVIMTWNNT